jgi:UDP-N-acetylmuramyl pentapeptide phosphotransferase/UDP-N-acetylglucosamine-1-phosphate transferase
MQILITMLGLAGLGAAAFLLSWALTGIVLRLSTGAQHRAHPNERTMHIMPTPNVGGLAIVATVLGLGAMLIRPTAETLILAVCVGSLSVVSLVDQYRPLWPLTRLLAQALAVATAISLLPNDMRLAAMVPIEVERVVLGLGWLWMINLTNFIDGIDGIAATGGAATALGYLAVLFWPLTVLDALPVPVVVAILLAGACLGYLVWNWHPARIFMGDTGSIPLGFLLGWLMLDLAQRGHWVSALILPAVWLADASLTLLTRVLRAEKVWRPHRSHFYQRAVQGGTSPASVVRRMLAADLALIALAVLAKTDPVPAALGASAVIVLLLAHWSSLAPRLAPSAR